MPLLMARLSLFLVQVAVAAALQLLSIPNYAGNHQYGEGLGVDFTVYTAIDISDIGLIDADAPGVEGTLSARIFDRTDGRIVAGPVDVGPNDQRSNDSNPFVFKRVSKRLFPGVYCLVAYGFATDQYINQGQHDPAISDAVILVVQSPALAVTGGVYGGNGSSIPRIVENDIYAAATFVFTVVNVATATLPPATQIFHDCQAVACAGLATGQYNIQGQVHFCDNDAGGGGWLRLWRANEVTCETVGWSSSRNPHADFDRLGCRPVSDACSPVRSSLSPFEFNEVLSANWSLWAFRSLDGFNVPVADNRLCDGIVVRDDNNETLFVYAASGSSQAESRCPCDPDFSWQHNQAISNLQDSGSNWVCAEAPSAANDWVMLFANSSNLCNPSNSTKATVRALANSQRYLRISLCADQVGSDEDLKLSSGDLFVRRSVNFTTATHCSATSAITTRSSTASPPTTSSTTAMTTTSAARPPTSSTTSKSPVPASASTTRPLTTELVIGITAGNVSVCMEAIATPKQVASTSTPMLASLASSATSNNSRISSGLTDETTARLEADKSQEASESQESITAAVGSSSSGAIEGVAISLDVIAGAIGGALMLLLLIAIVVGVVCKRWQSGATQSSTNSIELGVSQHQSEYASSFSLLK
jgi:hypothetical protein